MRGDALRVVNAFAAWLESDGWQVRREVEFADLEATRDDSTIYAEAKGGRRQWD